MFTGQIVGQANAMAGGWGNLGGGVTQATAPGLYEMFKAMGLNDNAAWRVSLQVPAGIWVIVAVCMILFADDCPEGHWNNRKLVGGSAGTLGQGIKEVGSNYVVWILVVNYACCFGVELYVNNSMSSYFQDQFGLEQFVAGLIASLFGLMNLVARAVGGWTSDKAAARFALRGRIWVILITVLGTGGMLVLFSLIRVLWLAILQLILFSCFVQAAEGATFGLVPFINKRYTGIVSGLVGAGGNLGAMSWGFIHKAFGEQDKEWMAYLIVGFICAGSALTCLLIRVHGAAALPCLGNDGSEWLAAQQKNDGEEELDYGYGYDMGMLGYGDFMPTPMSTPAAMYPSPYYPVQMVPMGMPY
jgi:NNP family nitrate/nitrite transporter-like MFS transporter